MNTNIFREYDIRGIVGEQLTEETVGILSGAIAAYLARGGARRIAVGHDARESSPIFAGILTRGLTAAGLDVLQLGMVPTPVVYHATYTKDVDGGVMITGSHNPPHHTGVKISLGTATLFGPQIQEIRVIALAETRPAAGVPPGRSEPLDVLPDYIADITSKISLGARKLKAVVDAGNGVGAITAVPVYERLGIDLVKLYADPDPTFPNHHPDPTVTENLADLQRAVVDSGADLGIAFDGDGDRIGIVDETGRIIWGDELMILLSRTVLAEHPGATIIAEVKCSQNLFDDIERNGGTAIMERPGHSIIKSRMKQTGAALAGEMSGHIFFADRYYGFDDALYAAVRLIAASARLGKSVTELKSAMPEMRNTPELRFQVDESRKFAAIEEVKQRLAGTDAEVNDTDGVRVTTTDGWWLLRASNTQDVLVARAESGTRQGLDRLLAQIDEQLEASGLERGPQAGH
jgi:phosphomannomutase